MKLNNVQLDALTSKIVKELDEEINGEAKNFNDNLNKSTEYIDFDKDNDDIKTIISIKKKYKLDPYHIDTVMRQIKSTHFNKKLKQIKYIDYSTIKQSIILSTIELENIDEIISKIKAEFKKKK